MKRSAAIQLTLVTSLAALLLGCEQHATRYCVDDKQDVADEQNCQHGTTGFHWYYVPSGRYLPNGAHVDGGGTIPPAGQTISSRWDHATGAAAESGSERGGIGEAGEEASGHGAAGEGAGE